MMAPIVNIAIVWAIWHVFSRIPKIVHKHLAEKRRLRAEREHFVDLMAARAASKGPYR